ncbi:MAG: hypothetical protein HDR25_03225 [Lachnospiraceae bacterium]|nr:hypothetical protein [Lachnospiraceae bacterium]
MKIKMQKQIALVLAILLFLSPLSEIRPYAAEAAESLTSQDYADKTQEQADEKTSLETPSSVQNYIEEQQTDIKSEAEKKESAEGVSETKTEQISEAEEETETATTAEDALESTSETASENVAQERDEAEEFEETDYPCPEALEPENVPYDQNQEEFTRKLVGATRARSMMPAKYDAREMGYLPEIRNQGVWGACWSFSLTGAMEVSMIRDMDISADSINLSERHLAYFGFNTGYDALDNANGDTMTSPASYYLDNGGNDLRGVIRLMNWNGGAAEEDYPYPGSTLPDALERTVAQDAAVYLENAYRYDFASAEDKTEAIKVVKKMIMDYGAVSWSYYNGSQYLNNEDKKSYYNYKGGTASAKTNHAIMAVGWDDYYAKENFNKEHQPENDGAWIIRNSWGDTAGEGGYIYISYEDVSLGSANPVYAVTVCDASKYDNDYFYGNTAFSTATIAARRAAQVYTMKSEHAVREKLTAVSLLIGTSDVEYELQIYKNPEMKDGIVTNPTSGTPMLDTPQTGTLGYAGLHTIALDKSLVFDADDRVSVVFTFPKEKPSMYFDRSYTLDNGQQKGEHVIAKGQSFYGSSLTSWQDNYENNRTFRINALTVDCDDVEEVPNIKEIRVTEAQDFSEYPKVNITWSKCTDVDCYRIYRAEDNGNYALIDTVGRSARSYTDLFSERSAAQYHYKIASVYGSSEQLSDVADAKIEGIVKGPKFTFSDYDSYTAALAWDSVVGAESYEVWKLSNKDKDYVHIADIGADDALSYIASTDDWGEYCYKVRAKQGDAYTEWSELRINRDLLWKQRDYYSAYFEWQPVQGAKSYKIWHKANGKTFSFVTTNVSVNLSMKSSNYLPCDEHQYYVEAYDAADAGGNKIYTSSTITFKMTPNAPMIDAVTYDDEKHITLAWSDVSGIDRIKIYRREASSETETMVADVRADALSYIDDVYKGKTYCYTLVPFAVNNKGEQIEGKSVISEETATFPDAVVLDTAQYVAKIGVELTWNAAKGADGYLIERSDNDGNFSVIAAIEDAAVTTYTDETVKRAAIYKYRMMSYFLTEDESRETLPVQNEIQAAVSPEPVVFSQIAEQKREAINIQDGTTRVGLSWNAVENAQSYAIYRSAASDQTADSYECIAKNITQDQYVDSAAMPDTTYSYKLIVTINGLSSEIAETEAKTITTKPILVGLRLFMEQTELEKNKEYDFQMIPAPVHYPYENEIIWSACDEDGNQLSVTQKNDTVVINGADGKEILFLSDNKIHTVQDSETVRITLTAAIDEIRASCEIFVYSNNFWVNGIKDVTYTGAAIKQTIDVYDGKLLLTEGVDYTVTYKNNVKVSVDETNPLKKPQITVKGKGSYTGEQTLYFEILPEAAEDVDRISVLNAKAGSIKTLEYQGEPLEPKPIIKYKNKTLTEGADYTLSYENNDGAGTASVVINGINDYKGTKRVTFKINFNLQNDSSELMRVVLDSYDVPYQKGGAKPTPKVYCGSRLLKEGTDYKLSYKNNKAVAKASDKKAPTIVITGKGFYKGKKEVLFNIVQQDIGVLTLAAKDKVYVNKAGRFTTSFVITDKDGKKLSAGKDYDKASVSYTYADSGKPVERTDLVPQGTMLRITVNATATGAYTGSISGVYRITAYDIAKAKVTVEPQIYTGNAIEPTSATGVKVTYKGYIGGLTEGVDYRITGYGNNTKKGTAKLYIEGIGDFGGTKTVNFKIKTKIFQWWWQNG